MTSGTINDRGTPARCRSAIRAVTCLSLAAATQRPIAADRLVRRAAVPSRQQERPTMTFAWKMPRTAMFAGFTVFAAYGAQAADISGAGATFPYPIYAKWADSYKQKTGNGLNYQSIGSGGGIKQITARTVTFGATDKPMSGDDLKKNNLVQFPMVMGGIVPVVNIEGIEPGQLVLDGPTLARIFMGEITEWDDEAIAKLNPDAKLPSEAIAVVHRSDGSGTTYNFTYYLGAVSPEWKDQVGVDASVEWPVGIGAKGNEGVAANVGQTANSIGYVEYAYALQNKMTYTDLVNKDGQKVAPESASFAAAAEGADWSSQPGFGVILADQPGAKSWPITAATFILIPSDPKSPEDAAEALKFFAWAYKEGDDAAKALDYIPMPDSVVSKVEETWNQIQADGKPVYQATN
jgi:phosphate transport system substrate-binding protein